MNFRGKRIDFRYPGQLRCGQFLRRCQKIRLPERRYSQIGIASQREPYAIYIEIPFKWIGVTIKTDIINNTLVNPYLSLLTTYVKPMLIHWAMVEYLPFSAYTIANKGVFKHTSENATSVDKNEVDFLVEKERMIAQNYTERFITYINFNNSLFPEYSNNSNADMFPSTQNNFTGWYI